MVSLNEAPTVDAGPDATVNEGTTFTRSGSFTDPDIGDSWTATVDYGDGSGVQALTPDGQTFTLSHAYADDGLHEVTVTVTDSEGESGSDTFTVTVLNVAPTVAIETVPQTLYKHEEMNLLAAFDDPGTADTWTALIDWGDGNTATGVMDPVNGTVTGSHAYTVSGSFVVTVSVSVMNDNGGIGVATLQVTVLDTLAAFGDLLSKVESLDLSIGVESSLTAKLEAGIHLLGEDVCSDRSLTALLDAFIRGINHWYEKDKLTEEAYNELITYAELIRLDILTDI